MSGMIVVIGVLIVVATRDDNAKPIVKSAVVKVPIKSAPVINRVVSNKEYYPNDSISRCLLDSAFETLKKRCIHIKNYVENAKSIKLYFSKNNTDYRGRRYGWKRQVDIQISLPYDYENLPPDMAGQTLYYYIGNGIKPGVVTNKWQGRLLCGDHVKSNDDVLYPAETAYLWLK